MIGMNAFAYVMNDEHLRDIPKVLETPKGKDGQDWDQINLDTLRELISPDD
jgi:deoxyribonuclease-4